MGMLVIEDDESIRSSVVELIEAQGHRCAEAEDGLQAVKWLRDNPAPDAIVLDIMMPGMDGIGVLQTMKENLPHLIAKTIVMSASPSKLEEAKAYSPLALLAKPFELDALIALLDRLTGAAQ